jgi:predicted outer membrane repeat protein
VSRNSTQNGHAQSTFSGNTAGGGGGGIGSFGASITITNSTFSGNTALNNSGGGISADILTVTNSTIASNTSNTIGGGISSGSTTTLKNTIIANNQGSDCFGAITSQGYNLASDGTCNLTASTDLPTTEPMLGPLQDNGGPTFTQALLPGSPAIDAGGDCPPPPTDQRGVSRPQGTACDIGAFEVEVEVNLKILSFTATPTLGTAPIVGVPVAFAVTVDNPSLVSSVKWDFDGNGTVDQTTTTLTTQYTYATAGSFPAKVTVVDQDGGQASATTTVTVQSPAQGITTAITLVQGLPLSSGQKNSLNSKLNDALNLLNRGNITGACGKLRDFVNQMNSLVNTGQLSSVDAARVLDEVRAIQISLGCR